MIPPEGEGARIQENNTQNKGRMEFFTPRVAELLKKAEVTTKVVTSECSGDTLHRAPTKSDSELLMLGQLTF